MSYSKKMQSDHAAVVRFMGGARTSLRRVHGRSPHKTSPSTSNGSSPRRTQCRHASESAALYFWSHLSPTEQSRSHKLPKPRFVLGFEKASTVRHRACENKRHGEASCRSQASVCRYALRETTTDTGLWCISLVSSLYAVLSH